jgi:hypothetical protein
MYWLKPASPTDQWATSEQEKENINNHHATTKQFFLTS